MSEYSPPFLDFDVADVDARLHRRATGPPVSGGWRSSEVTVTITLLGL